MTGPTGFSAASAAGQAPAPSRRVFTNRNLRMTSIAAMGFDMDHTLAVYDTDNFNLLCFELALDRLVRDKGYPEAVRSVRWDPDAAIRGLLVDKRLGNLLKVDAHGHITRVRHGFRFLEKDERRNLYPRGRIRIGSGRYRIFDTLFDLPEGSLYASIIDLAEHGALDLGRSRRALFDDIRETVDTLHADGSLKSRIVADLDRYFLRDPDLVSTLRRHREVGTKLFLLTNSEADYTAAVMDHLVGGPRGSWEDLFDLVVCFARKPGFFVARGPGQPVPAGEIPRMPNLRSICYVGGDAFFLERKLGCRGDGILYWGDHTYGDILRSKQSVGWRTAMIVPEVEEEIEALTPLAGRRRELAAVEELLEELVLEQDHLAAAGADQGVGEDLERRLGEALGQRARLQRQLRAVLNPHWESLFREGRAASRFGRQIMEFSCIYTSRVSNLLKYPADKFFARPVEVLPHERWGLPER